MRISTMKTLMMAFALAIANLCLAQQMAFPGAEGAGKFATGGRGTATTPTTVFEVTNLTDVNSPGSLRYALSQSTNTYPYRTIVFRVSGTIHLNSRLNIPRNTTVAGQTAPGDGICIADHPVVINGDNVIVRYVRFRMGDKNQLKTSPPNCGVPVAPFTAACMPVDGSGGDDVLGNMGNKNIIIDHCSVSWSSDEALTVYRGDSITLQYNFITEPLNYSYHFETGDTDFEHHGYGGIWGALHGTFHHNLIAHARSRTPRFGGNSTYNGGIESADFRNNVIYNWGIYNIYGGEGGQYNLVNNYFKYGPSTSSTTRYRIVNVDSSSADGWAKYYISGNYVDGSPTNTANNWSGAWMATGNAADTVKSKHDVPFLSTYPQVPFQSALDAYETVLANAGATLPRRDTLDKRIVNDVRYRQGRLIDVQGGYPHGTPYAQTVNAWPTLNSTTPPTDTDKDGMPDTWETANALNPNNAADRQTVAANGFTNLENYLNSITNTSPEVVFSGVLNSFTQGGATPSASQSISVSGYNLTNNVTITAPAGYEVSLDGTTWSTSVSLAPTAGALASTTVWIRLNGATDGEYNGYITATTTGAGEFYQMVNGRRNYMPPSTAATATWTLLTDQNPTTTGAITATPQTLGSAIGGTQYNSTFGGVSGWQRTATSPNLPVGFNPNSYVEYTITPAAGQYFVDTAISLGALGGGTGTARMAIYYSKDGFATSQSIGEITYNGTTYTNTTDNANPVALLNTSTSPLTGQQVARAATNIVVAPGETLAIRVYIWITGSGNRYFASQNVTVNGYTTDQNPMPLKLLSFNAAVKNKKVQLQWRTANEVNVDAFDVQQSTDGSSFNTIGKVEANNSTATNNYNFADPALLEGVRYYRLKMLDKDGSFTYSRIVVVNTSAAQKLSVYPNPASSFITVTHERSRDNNRLQVVTADGRIVQIIPLAFGATQTTIDVSQLAKGAYFIRLENSAGTCLFMKN